MIITILNVLRYLEMRLIRFIFIVFILNFASQVHGQTFQSGDSTFSVMKALIIGKDTLLVSDIPELKVYPQRQFKNRFQYWKYRRLIRNVKAAYPYAKIAAEKLKELDQRLASMPSERRQKAYIKTAEKEIREEFEDEVVHLTISQGRILIKLIDREVGDTTFEVLKDIKGSVSAVFWQAIARVFGSNLKSEYDAEGEDKMIEEIIRMIDQGLL